MSPFAIYSKTGKGVQEASGKTSLLDRADRVVLTIVDGRASVSELHERYGKVPASQFNAVIEKLEFEGFIRQVSAARAAPAGNGGSATVPLDEGTDLDFTSLGASSISRPPPQVDLAARARAEAERRSRAEAEARQARQEAEARARAQAEAKAKAEAEARARALAEAKARAEAEARARAQAEVKARAERDAALKAAAEAKARAEAEAKARAETEARENAAREAAVRAALEAKTRAEAELTAKLDAERKAREELERKLREQAERLASESREVRQEAQTGRVLTEVEELRQRLEEKRRAREEAERSAAGVGVHADAEGEKIKRDADALRDRLAEEHREREAADRRGKEDEERRAREADERRAKEEEERRASEAAERRAKEDDERKSLEESSRRAFEEADAAAVESKRREEEERTKREAEELEWKEQAGRLRREQELMQREAEEEARKQDEARRAKQDEEKKKKFLETQTLFADLTAFSEKEVVARPDPIPPKPAAPAPAPEKKAAAASATAPASSPAARQARDQAPVARTRAGGDDALRRDLRAAKLKARVDRRTRRRSEHRSDRPEDTGVAPPPKKEAKPKAPPIDWKKVADRSKRAAEKSGAVIAAASKQAARGARAGFQWSKRTYAKVQAYRRARAEQAAKIAKQKAKAREEANAAAEAAVAASAAAAPSAPATSAPAALRSASVAASAVSAGRRRKAAPAKWGARVVGGLLVLLVMAAGVVHVLPIDTAPYEKTLSEATGQPVKIGSATGWLITGPQIRFERVRIGDDIQLGAVHASPDLLALLSGELSLGRVELERAVIGQRQLGGALFGAAKGCALKGVRIVARSAKLEGPVKLPELDAEIVVGADGRLASATVRGPDALNLKISRKEDILTLEGNADKFAVPFVPGLELTQFTMAGRATPQTIVLSAWDGETLGGVLSGSANLRWTDGWSIEGALKARAMDAGSFVPTLVSEGRTAGQGTYSMRASDVAGLASTARIQGRFTIAKGTLAKIDLSRAVQTGGAQAVGRTPFFEMNGEASYDRGAVLIRNVRMVTGGALNAEANLDIAPGGALSGSVVAELSGRAQSLRTPVRLGGTLEKLEVGHQQ